MRCIIQRVRCARVEVEGSVVSSIGPGLLCLVGVKESDGAKDVEYICKKILRTRMFPTLDQARASWDEDVVTRRGEILCVSQFTLYARLKKPRPDFSKAMPPGQAKEVYEQFVSELRSSYEADLVKDGVFGAMMNVSLENDGPVTFILDSESDLAQ